MPSFMKFIGNLWLAALLANAGYSTGKIAFTLFGLYFMRILILMFVKTLVKEY